MQLKPLPVHRAEVLLFQKVAQTVEAIRVATRGVHRSDEGLQTDVANQFIVHIILIIVQMAFEAVVLLATLLTDPRPRQTPSAAAAGNFGFCCSHWPKEFSWNFCVSRKDLRLLMSVKTVFGIFHKSLSAFPELKSKETVKQ